MRNEQVELAEAVDETLIADSLRNAAIDAGYPVASLELLRVGNNYIFADRLNAQIYRVPVLPLDAEYLSAENGRLMTLAAAGAPILPPLQSGPFRLSTGHLATVWPLGESPAADPPVSLAPLLSRLHDVEPVNGLPIWAGFGRGHRRVRIARAGGVPDELVDEVSERLQRLEASFPDWSKATVVHGDPHLGNLVKIADTHRLIDLDDLALGCPEIDLAPMRNSYNRFNGVPGSWASFLAGYGHQIDDELLEWFVALRQLTMVAWLFTLWDLRPESQAEAIHRVATLDEAAKWNPL